MIEKTTKPISAKVRLYLDLVLFVGMVLVLAPQATGIVLHEWASFLIIIPVIFHILFDWKWIVSVTKRLLGKLPGETRFNHLWDTLLFLMIVMATFTGIVISEAALPALGITVVIDPFWAALHDLSANLLAVMIGVHLAMHWKWIVKVFKRYILRRPHESITPEMLLEGSES